MPAALVFLIHCPGLKTKLGSPACILKWSNSTTLKSGLYISSHVPKNSRVARFLIQFLIISAARESPSFAFEVGRIPITNFFRQLCGIFFSLSWRMVCRNPRKLVLVDNILLSIFPYYVIADTAASARVLPEYLPCNQVGYLSISCCTADLCHAHIFTGGHAPFETA